MVDTKQLVPLDADLIQVRSAADWDVVGGVCTNCGISFHPFRTYCAKCCRASVKATTLSKTGTVVALTTVYQVLPNVYPEPPYALAVIALTEGVTVKTVNAKDVDPKNVRVGQKVTLELAVVDEKDGTARVAYVFRPAEDQG